MAVKLLNSVISNALYIRKTCPCNIYPLEPHFYIAKLGFAGVHLFFLFLLKYIDCGYTLELPQRAKIRKNIKNVLMKIFHFYKLKNLCILHGRVFVMYFRSGLPT